MLLPVNEYLSVGQQRLQLVKDASHVDFLLLLLLLSDVLALLFQRHQAHAPAVLVRLLVASLMRELLPFFVLLLRP